MLYVNVYRDNLAIHAARMQADLQRTRDLMGRDQTMSADDVEVGGMI